jgi:hypothetical protein
MHVPSFFVGAAVLMGSEKAGAAIFRQAGRISHGTCPKKFLEMIDTLISLTYDYPRN